MKLAELMNRLGIVTEYEYKNQLCFSVLPLKNPKTKLRKQFHLQHVKNKT